MIELFKFFKNWERVILFVFIDLLVVWIFLVFDGKFVVCSDVEEFVERFRILDVGFDCCINVEKFVFVWKLVWFDDFVIFSEDVVFWLILIGDNSVNIIFDGFWLLIFWREFEVWKFVVLGDGCRK